MKDISSFVPKKILVLQQRQLGDVVVATPIFLSLRKKYPNALITLFTEERCCPLLEENPYLDNILTLSPQIKRSFWKQCQFYYHIFRQKYDLIIDLQQLPRCQIITFVSFAKTRLTYKLRHSYRKLLYTHYPVYDGDDTDYVSYWKTLALTPLGIEPSNEKPMLYLSDKDKTQAQKILNSVGITTDTKFITLDATHKHLYRRWAHYPELIQKIITAYPELTFFLLRAPGEEKQIQQLININPKRIVMPTIPPTLRQSMACMSFASFHLGNTSAPQHIALGLNVPALIILSCTAESWHFNPKNPPKGTPKQLVARVDEKKLAEYIAHQKQLKNTDTSMYPNVIEYPELNLITPEQVMPIFNELVANPYY